MSSDNKAFSGRVSVASPPPIVEPEGAGEEEESKGAPLRSPMRVVSPGGSDDSFETAKSRSPSRADVRDPFSPDPTAQEPEIQSLASTVTEHAIPEIARINSEFASAVENPFKNPSPDTSKADLDAPLLASPTQLSPSGSPRLSSRATLQVPRKNSSRSQSPNGSKQQPKRSSTAPPLVRPLDLPESRMPRMEPEPGTGHFMRVQRMPQQEQELEEELEADKEHGRWWTDWICGCRGNRRREDQVSHL